MPRQDAIVDNPRPGAVHAFKTMSGSWPPTMATAVEAIWPELAARVDDLSKLVEELKGMVEEPEIAGRTGAPQTALAGVLAVLRDARS